MQEPATTWDRPATNRELDSFYGAEATETSIDEIMIFVRKWLAMPWGQAQQEIINFMAAENCYSTLDFELVSVSESAEEAIGCVFGV